ncbi:MAG: ribonuclease HI [Bdellovibrionales bacterium]|nr:ribonuclease HI [Bdellovibrionales bacterium]
MSDSTSGIGETILIYTDGACSGNPGKGGWGAVVYLPPDTVYELGAGRFKTTNNQMELTATIEALESLEAEDMPIWLYTDSTYVIRGITQWIWGWKKKGWKNSEGNPVSNQIEWRKLEAEVTRLKKQGCTIDWRYIRGHQGHAGNERVDQIAVAMTHKKPIQLYDGQLLGYDVAIMDIPESHELPAMKDRKTKKTAYSYLSYVNGQLQRHATWKECEAVVKGRPGAKFKKAMSAEDEKSILERWGLSHLA